MNADRQRRIRLVLGLAGLTLLLLAAGLAAGSEGWSITALMQTLNGPDAALIVGQIRAPRTLGAWLTGALLGLAGATAQGLFRNPLADPYLLGSASGASLGVVLVLATSALAGQTMADGAGRTVLVLHVGDDSVLHAGGLEHWHGGSLGDFFQHALEGGGGKEDRLHGNLDLFAALALKNFEVSFSGGLASG